MNKNLTETRTCIRVFADTEQIERSKKLLAEHGEALKELSQVYSLIGNEVRLKILYLIKEEEKLCPCDLSDILGMTIPAISQHLRRLKDGKLLVSKREGQTVFYSLNKDKEKLLLPLLENVTS